MHRTILLASLLLAPVVLVAAPPAAAALECQSFSGSDRWWWRLGTAVREPVEPGATFSVSWWGTGCFKDGVGSSLACDAVVSDGSSFRITWSETAGRQVLGFYKGAVPIVATGASTGDHGWCDPDRIFVWTDGGLIRGRNARCDFSECGSI